MFEWYQKQNGLDAGAAMLSGLRDLSFCSGALMLGLFFDGFSVLAAADWCSTSGEFVALAAVRKHFILMPYTSIAMLAAILIPLLNRIPSNNREVPQFALHFSYCLASYAAMMTVMDIGLRSRFVERALPNSHVTSAVLSMAIYFISLSLGRQFFQGLVVCLSRSRRTHSSLQRTA